MTSLSVHMMTSQVLVCLLVLVNNYFSCVLHLLWCCKHFFLGPLYIERLLIHLARVDSGVVRMDPLRFLAGCNARRLDQVCLSYTSACFIVMLFLRAPFYVLLVFIATCSVFWLFWLSCHYFLSDWLERLLWGSLTVVRGSSP